ncbi:MAG: amino acid transporter [Actinomycetota bacterium]
MVGAGFGRWEPLDIPSVREVFGSAPFRWWISGGWALELHVGRQWRRHEDTDVGMCRRDAPALRRHLVGWDIHLAAGGVLTPWDGGTLDSDLHQNNLWCRRADNGPWLIDVTLGEGDDHEWIYRRDRSIRLAWSDAVLRTQTDVPYLAPELQLLFKSTNPRDKDQMDAAEVIPSLEGDHRSRLERFLAPDHPWRRLLSD